MNRIREQALTDYQRQIGRVLNCVAHAWAFTYQTGPDEYVLVSQDRNTRSNLLRLHRGRETLYLDASQRIQIFDADNFRISTRRYIYVLWSARPNERIIDWHYHRRQNNSFEAHLHVRDDAHTTNHYLVDRHIPTGRVPLEDVVRFAIQEVNIAPRSADWTETLDATEAVFRANRTW
jgi:hypothetical protein